MKHLCILLLALFGCRGLAMAQAPRTHADSLQAPRFEFTGGITHDFGDIPEGPAAEYVFKFKNTGRTPLVITRVMGDTFWSPDWSKEPILPGKTGFISTICPTQGRAGFPFNKTLRILSNALTGEDGQYLHIKGRVVAAPIATSPKG